MDEVGVVELGDWVFDVEGSEYRDVDAEDEEL